MDIRIRFPVVVQVLALLLGSSNVLGGELVESDIVAAEAVLLKLAKDGRDYQFEPKMSGCVFSSCSTELVRFRRDAKFTKVISEPSAPVVRKRQISCYSHDREWKCYPDAQLLAYVEGTSSPIGVASAVSDATVLDVISFFESECFRNQADDYKRGHPKLPQWALTNVHVYAIEPRGDQFAVSIWGPGIYVLRNEVGASNCRYAIQSFGVILF